MMLFWWDVVLFGKSSVEYTVDNYTISVVPYSVKNERQGSLRRPTQSWRR